MSERMISVSTYVAVCAVLIALTIITTAVSFLHLPSDWHLGVGMVIAAVKASLVLLFFMHALTGPRVIWAVIAVVLLSLIIFFPLTLCDYFTRDWVPYAPGH
jgi:cytochrome c oxidase subunit 4